MLEALSKKVRLIGVLLVLAVGVVGGVSFGASDSEEFKHEVVIKASHGKVWDLLSDPAQTPRWMPQDLLDIEKVEALEKPAPGQPTHRFILRDGRTILLVASEDDDDRTLRRKMISSDAGFDRWYSSMEWSFELEKIKDQKQESKLTFHAKYKLTRPVGVLRQTYRRVSGKAEADAKRMFDGIERAAREL